MHINNSNSDNLNNKQNEFQPVDVSAAFDTGSSRAARWAHSRKARTIRGHTQRIRRDFRKQSRLDSLAWQRI